LCNQQLTSETFWNAHVNGREHKQKLAELKSSVKQPPTEAVFAKPLPPPPVSQHRGIKRSHDDVVSSNDRVIVGKSTSSVPTQSSSHSALPADFFDSSPVKSSSDNSKITTKTNASTVQTPLPEEISAIPEGFFDDPHMDARIRKVEYVDKMEVEWDTFTREMKQETHVSEKIEANDDVERNFEREIKETNDLISRWQKIEDLHNQKDNLLKTKRDGTKMVNKQTKIPTVSDNDDDDEASLEQELQSMYNWRQKRS